MWPNLNVQRRQYRFRMLAADNTRVYKFQFDNNGTFLPFTIIGSDGGYLPAPQVVDELTLGITERADVLVDFSQFAAGTQIILRNTTPGVTEDTTGILMRFTVVEQHAGSAAGAARRRCSRPGRRWSPTRRRGSRR